MAITCYVREYTGGGIFWDAPKISPGFFQKLARFVLGSPGAQWKWGDLISGGHSAASPQAKTAKERIYTGVRPGFRFWP